MFQLRLVVYKKILKVRYDTNLNFFLDTINSQKEHYFGYISKNVLYYKCLENIFFLLFVWQILILK